jgi:hypothetical protein
VTYAFNFPEGVSWKLYNDNPVEAEADLEALIDRENATFRSEVETKLYILLENEGEEEITVQISGEHLHELAYNGACTVEGCQTSPTATTIRADEAQEVTYVAGGVYYYKVNLAAGLRYTMTLANATGTVQLFTADGEEITLTDNAFECATSGDYYVVVVADAASTGTQDLPATITVVSHTHTFDNKGVCTAGDPVCGHNVCVDMTPAINRGDLVAEIPYAGSFYASITLEAGYTYTFSFASNKITYMLFAADGETACELVDGEFACETAGTYYLVITADSAVISAVRVDASQDTASQ